jgi:valyl-tRNA synthetase
LRLAHPLIPFITEELWQKVAPVAGLPGPSVSVARYPEAQMGKVDEQAIASIARLKALVDACRNLRGEMGVSPAAKMPLYALGDADFLRSNAALLQALAKLSEVKVFDDADRPIETARASLAIADSGVAQVDGTTLSGLSIGATKLFATLQGTSLKAEAEVTVQQPAFELLELTAVSPELKIGDETTLTTVAKNGGGELVENVRPAFSSSDETVVAIVDGRARALKAGTAIVTATADDKTAQLTLTVTDPAARPVKGVKRR